MTEKERYALGLDFKDVSKRFKVVEERVVVTESLLIKLSEEFKKRDDLIVRLAKEIHDLKLKINPIVTE